MYGNVFFIRIYLYGNEEVMIINMIAAMAKNRVIGYKNQLPWNYPEDLKHFKQITTGHVVVMGYNTYLSIGRPLPNRRNVVLSNMPIEGIEWYASIDQMLEALEADGVKSIFIIGGASIYQQCVERADYIYLTEMKKEFEGDTFFPHFEEHFEEVSREEHLDMDFVKYKKK